jgi:hypothetical protein
VVLSVAFSFFCSVIFLSFFMDDFSAHMWNNRPCPVEAFIYTLPDERHTHTCMHTYSDKVTTAVSNVRCLCSPTVLVFISFYCTRDLWLHAQPLGHIVWNAWSTCFRSSPPFPHVVHCEPVGRRTSTMCLTRGGGRWVSGTCLNSKCAGDVERSFLSFPLARSAATYCAFGNAVCLVITL